MGAHTFNDVLSVQAIITGVTILGLLVTACVVLWRKKRRLELRIGEMLDDIKIILRSHATLQDQNTDSHSSVQNYFIEALENVKQLYQQARPTEGSLEFNCEDKGSTKILALRYQTLQAEREFLHAGNSNSESPSANAIDESAAWDGYRQFNTQLAIALNHQKRIQVFSTSAKRWSHLRCCAKEMQDLWSSMQDQKESIQKLQSQLTELFDSENTESFLSQCRQQIQALMDNHITAEAPITAIGKRLENYELEIERLEQDLENLLAESASVHAQPTEDGISAEDNLENGGELPPSEQASSPAAPTLPQGSLAVSLTTTAATQSAGELQLCIASLVEENNELRQRVERLGRFVQGEKSKASSA